MRSCSGMTTQQHLAVRDAVAWASVWQQIAADDRRLSAGRGSQLQQRPVRVDIAM